MRNLMLWGLLLVSSCLLAHSSNFATLSSVCNARSESIEAAISLTGTIITSESNEPLEYATVSAYDVDSLLVDGTVSNANGQFELNLIRGTYRIQIEFIGFESRELDVELKKDLDLGNISLSSDGLTLDAVEVRAEKSEMNLLLDKKVFNIGQDALSQGGSANEVLEQLPSVTVSADGQVSLRGNSGVKILINGRPSALADNNALAAVSAESIEKVEIITNPSARYEASGTAGIINIILKKEQQKGYGGTVSTTAGYPANYQLNANLNLRREKYNAFMNFGTRYSNFRGAGTLDRSSTLTGEEIKLAQLFDQDRNDKAINGYVGLDYNVNPNATLTATYSLYHMINDDFASTDYNYTDASAAPIQTLRQELDYLEPGTYQQLDLIYTQDLANEGEKMTLYFKNDLWEEQESEDTFFDEQFPSGTELLRYRTSTIESSRDHLLQADYERKLGENSTLEVGIRGETRIISSDYLAERNLDDEWSVLADFDNKLDYFERIGAVYAQYAFQHKAFGFQLGLRNEYTLVRVENVAEPIDDIRKTYNRLFPSVNTSYKFTDRTSTQLSYSRRIRRPSFWQLNPFRGIDDPNTLFIGNPDLDPTYTDKVELNFLKQWEKLTINPAVYASTASDYFEFVIDQEVDNLFDFSTGTILTRPVNLERENELGLELVTNFRPNDNWNLSGEFNYFHYQQRGQFEERNFDFDFATWSGSLRLSVNLPKDIRFQARGYYSAPYKTVQSIRRSRYNGSFSISKQWNNRITLSINTRSPNWNRSSVFRPNFTQEEYRAWNEVWRSSINFQYRFEKGADSQGRRERGSIR